MSYIHSAHIVTYHCGSVTKRVLSDRLCYIVSNPFQFPRVGQLRAVN